MLGKVENAEVIEKQMRGVKQESLESDDKKLSICQLHQIELKR